MHDELKQWVGLVQIRGVLCGLSAEAINAIINERVGKKQ